MRVRVNIGIDLSNGASIGEFASYDSPEGANVSNFEQIFNQGAKKGIKGFQLSANSILDGSFGVYADSGYEGFVSRSLAGKDITIPFNFSNGNPFAMLVVFDKVAKEYAVDFTISRYGSTVTPVKVIGNKSYTCLVDISSLWTDTDPLLVLLLTINKWSTNNASVKILQLALITSKDYFGKDLISMKCSENVLDSQMQISPGICEQYADIVVYDRDKLLHTLAAEGMLGEDFGITVYAQDDITYTLGTYLTSDWDIEGTNSEVGIICRDKSHVFEKINIPRINIADRTVDDLLRLFFSYTNFPWKYATDEVKTRCQSITIKNCWFAASTLKVLLNDLCAVGMLRVYWSNEVFIVGLAG